MLGALLASLSIQIGPFWESRPDDGFWALRPIVSREKEDFDVLWPVYASHRDWWRFMFLAYWQEFPEPESYQFTLLPVWFNGRDAKGEDYWGLFPLYGHHPHILAMDDFTFALWPLWHRYSKPRGRERLVTNAVLFPFISWRSDGSWGLWPIYGVNHARESDHRYALWPFVTWASYREDRDTAGAGSSWMVWPVCGRVERERETQTLVAPPFFSYAETASGDWKLRSPWPFIEVERTAARRRTSVWPLWESVENLSWKDGSTVSSVTRFGWKLVEIYDDETRVFPFWSSGRDHTRLWPLWESETRGDVTELRFLDLIPIRWVPAIDRNWAKYWTLYESVSTPLYTDHSLFWGLIRWRTEE